MKSSITKYVLRLSALSLVFAVSGVCQPLLAVKDPVPGIDILVKKPSGIYVQAVDPNTPTLFTVTILDFKVDTRLRDPNAFTNAIGLAVGTGLTVTGAAIVDKVSHGHYGGVPAGFDPNGLSLNATTGTTFESLSAAGGGKTWFGFSGRGSVATADTPPAIDLVFNVTAAPGLTPKDVHNKILVGQVGVAQADATGGAFDNTTAGTATLTLTTDTIPTLSELGLVTLAVLLVLGGTILVMRKRAQGSAV